MTAIGLWGIRPIQPEETAQGLLLRIAEVQRHESTDRTERAAGISRARMARGSADMLRRFAAEVVQDFERIASDSPVRDTDGLRLRGHLMGDLVHAQLRRLCPACLEESWHHRFWWDIRTITTCPRHGLELAGACACGAALGWRSGGLVRCLSCSKGELSRIPRTPADAKVLRTDGYLLSRLDAGEAESVAVLDALSFLDVCRTLERVGAACDGYSYEWKSAEALGLPLSVVQARGFEVLADGKFEEVLTKIYDGFIAQGGRPEEGFTSCYGWLYHWFNHKRGAKFSPLLAEAFHAHGAARFPIVPKARLGKLPVAAVRKLSLKAAAAKAGVSVYGMKSIGLALGLIRTEKRSGSQISFPAEEVERIARDLRGAINLGEAQQRLGVGFNTMAKLVADGTLVPALRGGGRRHNYVFRTQDIDAFLAKLARGARKETTAPKNLLALTGLGRGKALTIAEGVRWVLDGRLQVRVRLGGQAGLQCLFVDPDEFLPEGSRKALACEAATFSAAAVRMRLNARGLRRAIEAGLIDGVEPGASVVPDDVVHSFSERFMMLAEIRDRLGGSFPDLRNGLRRAGFPTDPALAKCLCAAYIRSDIEPFVRQLETGKVSLARPEGSWKALVREAEKLLAAAKMPLASADLLSKLRRKMSIGPSDQNDFFYTAMWDMRATIVFIGGAGWWLRSRPYMGRPLPSDGPAPTQADIVDDTVLQMLREASRPLSQDDILAELKAGSIRVPLQNGEVFLRRFFVRHADKLIKLTGLGYWDRSRAYTPALYDPATWKERTQTAVQRAGLWIIKLIEDAKRPLTRAELESTLRKRGLIPEGCSRAYVGNAVGEFASAIVYLDGVGYWLTKKPWPAVGYKPSMRKHAA